MDPLKLSKFLHTLPDHEVMEPADLGVLLNKIQREHGYPEAMFQDVKHERARRFNLRRKENQFGRDLVAIEMVLGLPHRTLTAPYWEIREQFPLSKSFQTLAEHAQVPLLRLTEEYAKLHTSETTKSIPKKRVAKDTKLINGDKAPPARPETVLAIRQLFLDEHSPTEIYNRQFEQLLPGTDHVIKQGNITYYCTNRRQPQVGFPVLGVVTEVFMGKDGPSRAAKVLRGRYREALKLGRQP